jgi:hypothetical protein
MNERDEIAQMMQDSAGISWGTEEHFHRFSDLIRAYEREKCSKTRAGKPRRMPTEGKGALWYVAASCFDKGWREGAASVRKAIRARGNT